MPSKDKISARRTTLTASPMFMFATNADMLAWATQEGRLITTRAEFDAVVDLDLLLVFSTFYYDIQVKDESPNAAEGATLPAATFGFNFGSKRSDAARSGCCSNELFYAPTMMTSQRLTFNPFKVASRPGGAICCCLFRWYVPSPCCRWQDVGNDQWRPKLHFFQRRKQHDGVLHNHHQLPLPVL